MGTGIPGKRATETGDQNSQRALLACSQLEKSNMERGPLDGSAHLMRAATKGGKGGTPHPEARTSQAQIGEESGHPDKAACSPSAQPGYGGGGKTPHTAARS